MEYFVKIIEALAWPVTVFVLVIIFRGEVSKILDRITSLKYKDFEANFEKQLREAEQQAEHIRSERAPAELGTTDRLTSPQVTVHDQLLRIAEVSPRAAITEAWREVESAATNAAETAGLEAPRRMPINHLVRELIRERIFSDTALPLFDRLRRLRNEAAHAPEFIIDQGEVERYVDLALRLANDLFHAGNALALVRGRMNFVGRESDH